MHRFDRTLSQQTLGSTSRKFLMSLVLIVCACSEPMSVPDAASKFRKGLRMSGSSEPSRVLADAMAGIHRRGEQDDMLKREVALPGFGGFYIDSSDRMVVYMKPSSNKSTAMVRAVLATAYANRKEPRVREVMSRISEMRVVDGEFSLSELIAGENRLAYSTTIIPGYVGVGVSLANNRLVLGLKDSASIDPARRVAMSLGVPADMLVIEVWGEVITTSKWTDRWRPGRAGIVIRIANGQFNSIAAEVESHGFTVKQVSTGATYFMSAAHGPNSFHGANGYLGDTVFQAYRSDGAIGVTAVNTPWPNANCPTNPANGLPFDYCLDADVALFRYINGATGDRKVGTSTYEGQNGNVGTSDINGFYSIQSAASPEWIATTNNGVHKSGFQTGTTTGAMQLPTVQVSSRMCWNAPANNCPANGGGVYVFYWNVTKVNHAGWGLGDSGGAVFAGNGSPYYALGIQVAGSGMLPTDTLICRGGTNCAFYFNRWDEIQNWLQMGELNPSTNQ